MATREDVEVALAVLQDYRAQRLAHVVDKGSALCSAVLLARSDYEKARQKQADESALYERLREFYMRLAELTEAMAEVELLQAIDQVMTELSAGLQPRGDLQ
jgi:hypothetical protein